MCELFQFKQLKTSVFHPQKDSLVERFNKMQKFKKWYIKKWEGLELSTFWTF